MDPEGFFFFILVSSLYLFLSSPPIILTPSGSVRPFPSPFFILFSLSPAHYSELSWALLFALVLFFSFSPFFF
jgi:hypothetical protein